jgi:hypothetical protein
LPNIAISVVETSGNYIHCFTRTPEPSPSVSMNWASKIFSHLPGFGELGLERLFISIRSNFLSPSV